VNFNEYQHAAERTANRSEKDNDKFRFANFGLGITGEAGEVADLLKKHVFHGHELNRDKLAKELGDVMWYVATIATTANLSLEEIAEKNIEKLRKRYPNGFKTEDSVNRRDEQ
jgi:NTP pyrophosphatase (non-canonical NTP hydrolase)